MVGLWLLLCVPMLHSFTVYLTLPPSLPSPSLPLPLHPSLQFSFSFSEALSDLKAAITLHSSLLPAHLIAGLIYYNHLHNSQRAVRYLTSALDVDPTCHTALLARAEALISQGKVSLAHPVDQDTLTALCY